MSDEDDDYLSDKFLVGTSAPAAPVKTYSQIRKDAQRQAKLKEEENRLKSRRQLELESRAEGLSKSLFTRAKEDDESGLGSGNKALSIMMKMGFKPGQSLGQVDVEQPKSELPRDPEPSSQPAIPIPQHKTEPIPLNEWEGMPRLNWS